MTTLPLSSPLFPYTTLFRSLSDTLVGHGRTSTFTRDPEHALRVLNELQPDQVLLAVDDSDGNNATDSELVRSEEHTSELQSRGHLVCRLLLEKKNNNL